MDYLKDKQHYIDLYDLFTINKCLDINNFYLDLYKKKDTDKRLKEIPVSEQEKGFSYFFTWHMRTTRGERYRNREKIINEWMEKDKLQQDKQDYTPTPENIICPLCNAPMYFNITKHLDSTYDSPILHVMFLFKCSKCEKQQWVYDNGEIRVSKPDLCPKCKKELDVTGSRKGKVITTLYKCKQCDYLKKDILDLAKSDEEHKKWEAEQNQKEDEGKKLLEKYRAEFCLSDKDGQEYIELMEAMEVANVINIEEKQKYDDPAYEIASKIKKIKIIELEKLLTKDLDKSNYTKLEFGKPEIGRDVVVSFTVQDSDSSRREKVSISELEKLVKNILENTNWRLLTSIIYRLGFLEGRLKGYESDGDILKLAGKMEKPKPKPQIDEAKRQKYATNNVVQLAKLMGELDGIENMRKRRLEDEPDGFFLNDNNEGYYNCGICGEGAYGNDIWWNLDGIKCRNCLRNIKEGVIPQLKNRHDSSDVYFSNWQVQSNYGVHPATRAKLRREGLLKGRDLKNEGGQIYCTIYLISENKEFLKKYPKLKSEHRETIITFDGRTIEL
jgi:C4-type Zn-finger protein